LSEAELKNAGLRASVKKKEEMLVTLGNLESKPASPKQTVFTKKSG
jgi:hypothetical protein